MRGLKNRFAPNVVQPGSRDRVPLDPAKGGVFLRGKEKGMAEVICICGKICCGKTTYAKRLCREKKAVLLSVDEEMLGIFGKDAGEKHDEYTAKIKRLLLEKSLDLWDAGVSVVLDWGFWQKKDRADTKAFYQARGVPCFFHFLDVPDKIWRARIETRNRAVREGKIIAYEVDEGLAAKFLSRFETPEKDEIDVWQPYLS